MPIGAWRYEFPAKPAAKPAPAAARSGGTPDPPVGIGGNPETSRTSRRPLSPVSGRSTGLIVGIEGSAPYDTSSFMASTSAAYAARQNAVAPASSMPD